MDYLIPFAACAVSAGIGYIVRGAIAVAYRKRITVPTFERMAEAHASDLDKAKEREAQAVKAALAEQAARAYTDASKQAYADLHNRIRADGNLSVLPKAPGLTAIEEKQLRARWETEDAQQRHESYLWCAWQDALESLGRECARLTVEDVKLVQDARWGAQLTVEKRHDMAMYAISVILPAYRAEFAFDIRGYHRHD